MRWKRDREIFKVIKCSGFKCVMLNKFLVWLVIILNVLLHLFTVFTTTVDFICSLRLRWQSQKLPIVVMLPGNQRTFFSIFYYFVTVKQMNNCSNTYILLDYFEAFVRYMVVNVFCFYVIVLSEFLSHAQQMYQQQYRLPNDRISESNVTKWFLKRANYAVLKAIMHGRKALLCTGIVNWKYIAKLSVSAKSRCYLNKGTLSEFGFLRMALNDSL